MSSITSSPSAPPGWCSADVLCAVLLRAKAATRDLVAAHRAFIAAHESKAYGALAVAVSTAQQVLKALELIKEEQKRNRYVTSAPPLVASGNKITSSLYPPGGVVNSERDDTHGDVHHPRSDAEMLQQMIEAEKYRIELRRLLPRAVAAIEESNGGSGGGRQAGSSAASAAASLRSLLQTRSLLSVELQKMDASSK